MTATTAELQAIVNGNSNNTATTTAGICVESYATHNTYNVLVVIAMSWYVVVSCYSQPRRHQHAIQMQCADTRDIAGNSTR